ncbi:MAG: AAA family ATPase [Betaproteobacteria bacterium]|nr:AAA family ATPase [Betaproteobacteria bacterium]MDH3437909.1 AAA family ATPase [Betaproteobacteria bacterium]
MYETHFGLREMPFGITPDTSFAYTCTAHQAALNTLLVAVKNGEGFIKITGEVGTGKTLLCRRFMATLDDKCVPAYIPNPYLEPLALLLALADELGVAAPEKADQHDLLREVTRSLVNFAREGKTVVLCLDEAQAMPIETLEALRLLTNLETEKRKLLQVVLFGQPELDEKLARESVRQLRQRITFQYVLTVLSRDEIEHYITHRLRVAGYRGSRLFTPPAVRLLYRRSHGVPRLVNIIAHKAMLLAYGEGAQEVLPVHVHGAVADTPSAQPRQPWWWLGFTVLLLSFGGISWALLQ